MLRYFPLLLLLALTACGDVSLSEIKSSLRQTAEAQGDSVLLAFYDARDYAPYWTQQDRLSAEADSLLYVLCHAADHALNPADYGVADIEARYARAYGDVPSDTARARALAELEMALAGAFVRYAQDVTEGRLRPEDVNGQWHMRGERFDAVAALRRVSDGDLRGALQAQHAGYAALHQALQRYRAVAERGGWPTVPRELAPGDSGAAVQALRQRLAASDDLEATGTGPYDRLVAGAVRRFQQRHGLPSTGAVDADTRVALNVSAEARVRQLERNLERRRWMPVDLGAQYVLVNIPDYRLYAYRDGERALEMDVVVGREYSQTPIFADTMQYVVFAPYWNVPPSITLEEILPKARRDPGYLAANHYQVVSGEEVVSPALLTEAAVESGEVRVRQTPGPHNALGHVKFMFPNSYNIYLHDTPADALFSEQTRSFSHGCVRLADPVAFARFVLDANGGWDETRIREAMQQEREQNVRLERRLPVYLTYLTAWAEEDGTVQFRDDVYGHDARLDAALARRRSAQTQAACASLGTPAEV